MIHLSTQKGYFLKLNMVDMNLLCLDLVKQIMEKYFANKNVFNIDIIGKLEYNTYKGNTKKTNKNYVFRNKIGGIKLEWN